MKASLLLPLTTLLLSLITTTTAASTECFETNKELKNLPAAIKGLNNLGFKLLSELKDKKSLVVSPFSLWRLLSYASVGAEGETLKEILTVLGPDVKNAIIHLSDTLAQGYDKLLTTASALTFKDATRFFMKTGFNIKKCVKEFGDITTRVNFGNPYEAGKTINAFVNKTTNTLVPMIEGYWSIPKDTKMLLLNALYFKGMWKVKFNKGTTRKMEFHPFPDAKTKLVDMMYASKRPVKTGAFPEIKARVLQLPFIGDFLFMTIILPNAPGLSAFDSTLNSLSHDTFMDSVKNIKEFRCDIYLPKFNFRSDFQKDLIEAMARLRMTKAFENSADFSSFQKGFYIKEMAHIVKIDMDEAGTEAGSAIEDLKAVQECEGGPFKVDRPFIFVVHTTDHLVLSGAYLGPN